MKSQEPPWLRGYYYVSLGWWGYLNKSDLLCLEGLIRRAKCRGLLPEDEPSFEAEGKLLICRLVRVKCWLQMLIGQHLTLWPNQQTRW